MGSVTNETPENPQNIPPIPAADSDAAAAGAHDIGGLLSSETPADQTAAAEAPVPENVADAAPTAPEAPAESIPAPAETAVEIPEPVAASEPVVAPEPIAEPEPVVAPEPAAAPPLVAPGAPMPPASSETPAQPGVAPAYPGAAPAYDPNATAAYPGAAPAYDPNAAAYAGAAPAYDPSTGVPVPGGYPVAGYPAQPPAAKKPMSKGLLFGLIGGGAALVLLIAAAIIVPVLLRGPAQTASGIVEEYLTALAAGDAEAALEFIDVYGDDSLLTDEMLAASLAIAPITDIVVEETESSRDVYESEVSARFMVGDETIERDFTVWNYGDGDWRISDGLVSASLSAFEGLGLTINGFEPQEEYTELFPGTYQLALAYEEFVIDAESDTFTLADEEHSEVFYDLYPKLSDEGAATFRSLVRASLEECIALKTLATPCGMDLTGIDIQGYEPVDGSVTRTITAEGQKDLDSLKPQTSYSYPTMVSTYDSVDIDTTLEGEKDGETAQFEVWFGGRMGSPSVDFSEETPVVTWE